MIEIASAVTPQLASPLSRVVRTRRRRSPKYAAHASCEHDHSDKSDPIVDSENPLAESNASESLFTVIPTVGQSPPTALKSP
jgi:hypothetical protein